MEKQEINELISALMQVTENFELTDEQRLAVLTAVSYYVDQL